MKDLRKLCTLVRLRHREGRVLSFFSSRRNWDSPSPHTQASVPPPLPFGSGGGAHSLAREGVGVSHAQRGDRHIGTLYIYVLCGLRPDILYLDPDFPDDF
jgi:hypothetical protein